MTDAERRVIEAQDRLSQERAAVAYNSQLVQIALDRIRHRQERAMSDEETIETTVETTVEGDAFLTSDGCLIIPTNLPAGSVVTITVTIGPREAVAPEPQPAKPRHMGGGRINGGTS